MMVGIVLIFYLCNNFFAGPANEEVLLQWLMQCREPSVQHLTDSTFEHLTQVKNLTCLHLNQAGGGEIP